MAKKTVARPRPLADPNELLDRRRTTPEILAEYHRLWDKVWWNRHMACHSPGRDCSDQPMVGCDPARAMVDKYGLEALMPGDQNEWGRTCGQMMGLAWCLGADWRGSGDT
jgi:hypothetical protein